LGVKQQPGEGRTKVCSIRLHDSLCPAAAQDEIFAPVEERGLVQFEECRADLGCGNAAGGQHEQKQAVNLPEHGFFLKSPPSCRG
jgi:hypothetical protein